MVVANEIGQSLRTNGELNDTLFSELKLSARERILFDGDI
jgi:hypothetical protein